MGTGNKITKVVAEVNSLPSFFSLIFFLLLCRNRLWCFVDKTNVSDEIQVCHHQFCLTGFSWRVFAFALHSLTKIALVNCCKIDGYSFFSASIQKNVYVCFNCLGKHWNWNNCCEDPLWNSHSTFSNSAIQQKKQTTQFMQINYKFGRYLFKHLIKCENVIPGKGQHLFLDI